MIEVESRENTSVVREQVRCINEALEELLPDGSLSAVYVTDELDQVKRATIYYEQ